MSTVTVLRPQRSDPAVRRTAPRNLLGAAALVVAAALALSPVASGYYDLASWAPLGLGAVVLLAVIVTAVRPRLTSFGIAASAGIALLLALSFASLLWAESRDSAWTAANQLAVYAMVFAIGLVAVRARRDAQAVLILLGLPALVSSLVLALSFAGGAGAGDLTQGRLEAPIGYVNGTAGLMVMGLWPWLGLAESARSPRVRAGAVGAAALIATLAVTTQTRALVPAIALSAIVALIAAPGRTRRGLHLLILGVAVAISAHWTLSIYSSAGPRQALTPPEATFRGAGLAVIAAGVLAFALKRGLDAYAGRVPVDRRQMLSRRLGQALLALTVLSAVAIGLAAHHRIATEWNAFTSLKPEVASSDRFLTVGSGYRYDLWRVALREFSRHPLTGVGAGNYDSFYYVLRHQSDTVTVPHSLELQMPAELGIGGAIGLALLLAAVFRAGLSRRRLTLASSSVAIRVGALGLFTAWLTATSVDWLYEIPGLTGMAFLAAAILVAPAPTDTPAASLEAPVPPHTAAASLVAPAPPHTAAATLEAPAPPHTAAATLVALAPPDAASAPGTDPLSRAPQKRTGAHRIATRAWPVVAVGLLAVVAASLGRQYVAALYGNSGQRLVSTRPVQSLRELRTAEQLNPWSMQTQYAVAAAYARLNRYTAARRALEHAAALEPTNYVPPALLGDLATRRGDYAAALTAYRRALRLDPREPALHEAVARALDAMR